MMSSNLRAERETIEKNAGKLGEAAGRAHVYGEMQPAKIWKFLKYLSLSAGTRFYDLGAGTGKVPAMAWFQGLNATGLELSEARVRQGCTAYSEMKDAAAGQVEIKNADFLRYDWSDADVVYTNSIMFSTDIIAGMAKIAAGMKEGALIFSGHPFPNPETGPKVFKSLGEFVMTEIQEIDLTLFIQQRVGPPQEPKPTCLEDIEGACTWKPAMFTCSSDDPSAPIREEL